MADGRDFFLWVHHGRLGHIEEKQSARPGLEDTGLHLPHQHPQSRKLLFRPSDAIEKPLHRVLEAQRGLYGPVVGSRGIGEVTQHNHDFRQIGHWRACR